MAGKLGEILLKENLITPDQLKQALEDQKVNGGRLGNSLVKLGFMSDDEVIEAQERKRELEEIVSFIDEGQYEALELEAQDETTLNLEQLERAAEEAPVIKLVNYFLTDAMKRGASDIHLEPYEKEYRVRHRIDGILQTIINPPNKLHDAIISSLIGKLAG